MPTDLNYNSSNSPLKDEIYEDAVRVNELKGRISQILECKEVPSQCEILLKDTDFEISVSNKSVSITGR